MTALVDRLRAAGCVFAEDEAELLLEAAAGGGDLETMLDRRCAGEPLEHVVGWADFAGVRVLVGPGVFVPRLRSELLVDEAARRAAPGSLVIDLCCGAGGIAAALLARRPDLEVHAADVDPGAVAWARRNLPPERVHLGDLFDALPPELEGRIDVIVANAPYVPSGEVAFLHADARDHEPPVALDGGDDGLELHRRIVAECARWLAPGGSLVVELASSQLEVATMLVRSAELAPTVVRSDELDATVLVGRVAASGQVADAAGRRPDTIGW